MEKTKEIKTVERTVTVKLPEDFDEYLQHLAKAIGKPVENVLLEELYGVLTGFFSSGFAEGWAEYLTGIENEQGKRIESEIKQIADKMFDC